MTLPRMSAFPIITLLVPATLAEPVAAVAAAAALAAATAAGPVVSAQPALLDSFSPLHTLHRSFVKDPILEHRPPFARSLPVQVLITGVILALVVVLIIHLLFTAQYHWPLAQVNFSLQLSGALTLLTSLIATIHVIFNETKNFSSEWPYMMEYIAIDMPPLTYPESEIHWSTASTAAWLLMNATTSGIVQITHIQFLTLLYPSHIEKRLILSLLGPIALLSAAMQLLPIHTDKHVLNVAEVVSNVCNATLSLLFTAALFIWGFYVNRTQAWRLDGGTAAFGAGACFLATAQTVLAFISIPTKNRYTWLPGLLLAIIQWQSFLGWWWWVGAGMGVGEVEELVRRAEKRRRRRRRRDARRKERNDAARDWWRTLTLAFGGGSSSGSSSSAGTAQDGRASTSGASSFRSRPRPGPEGHTVTSDDESPAPASEPGPMRVSGREPRGPRTQARHRTPPASTIGLQDRSIPLVPTASTTSTASSSSARPSSLGVPPPLQPPPQTHAQAHPQRQDGDEPGVLRRWYASLSQAHLSASRQQAAAHGQALSEVYGSRGGGGGWSLGAFGVREAERRGADGAEAIEGLMVPASGGPSSSLSPSSSRDTQNGDDEKSERRKWRGRGRGSQELPPPTVQSEAGGMWSWGPLRKWRLQDSTGYQ